MIHPLVMMPIPSYLIFLLTEAYRINTQNKEQWINIQPTTNIVNFGNKSVFLSYGPVHQIIAKDLSLRLVKEFEYTISTAKRLLLGGRQTREAALIAMASMNNDIEY